MAKIDKEKIEKIICEKINEFKSAHLNEVNDVGLLVEMARINTKDNGLFPYNSFDVKIWSNDHNPPHFHVIKDGWDVSFLIENGKELEIKSRGSKKEIYNYMVENVVQWLSDPCAILPAVSNRDNAMAMWQQMHDNG